jgi:hypothetical protein
MCGPALSPCSAARATRRLGHMCCLDARLRKAKKDLAAAVGRHGRFSPRCSASARSPTPSSATCPTCLASPAGVTSLRTKTPPRSRCPPGTGRSANYTFGADLRDTALERRPASAELTKGKTTIGRSWPVAWFEDAEGIVVADAVRMSSGPATWRPACHAPSASWSPVTARMY